MLLVINYLKIQSPAEKLSFKQITLKLVMLIALLSGQRAQSFQLLDIRKMNHRSNCVVCVKEQLIKQTTPSYHTPPIVFKCYLQNVDLCVVHTLHVNLE